MSASQVQITSPEEIADPLAQNPQPPDRLFYATGMLLDAEDFKAEQLYHRGRLSRALSYLHGGGTVAGLRVAWSKPLEPGDDPKFPKGRAEEIIVQPGIAVDRLGRLIEVPASACIRLALWFEQQPAAMLFKAFHAGGEGDPSTSVVVDVFIRYFSCERGKTPAFATGPFDALDAVQPSRMREFYKLELVPREHNDPELLKSRMIDLSGIADVSERRNRLREGILDEWREGTEEAHGQWKKNGGLGLLPEHEANQDPTSLFLARLKIPADPPAHAGEKPIRKKVDVSVDNLSRRFVYTGAWLASWLGI
ncbi:MAG TPA: hypothetical protein VKD91_14775 [Pyrinomonadaceae bacterium]|nr:hypothetical protein [Pyrinomonadaceae bacterium]